MGHVTHLKRDERKERRSMADHIKIRKATGTWVVRAGGAVLAESSNALELSEGDYTPVIYFPQADIAMAFLEKTESSTRCPYKGTASYFTLSTADGDIPDAAWSYEDPMEGVARIKDHIAFYTDRVSVEQL
jgi:uncharacterized protein (DUF427 family)